MKNPAATEKPTPREAMAELARRRLTAQAADATTEGLLSELFAQQVAFVRDTSTRKAALCTRRAGKTSMWCRYAPMVALQKPRSLIRLWGPSRLRAKQLLWDDLKLVAARHRIGDESHFNETELTFTLPNGSAIRLVGADKDRDAQRKRGDKTALDVVLEAQLHGPQLQRLVEEVIEPCLFDLRGTLCLEGTPGPVCAGYWYEVTGRDDVSKQWTSKGGKDGLGAGWSVHRWSVLDNVKLPAAAAELAALIKRKRWTAASPIYLREWKAQWVKDDSALFYAFDEARNTFTLEEKQPWGPGWTHVLGWDLGSVDNMALVVWGWHEEDPTLYEALSWKSPDGVPTTATEVMDVIKAHEGKFNIVRRVADTQGGGRMMVDEMVSRHGVVFSAAKKSDKPGHVLLLNDDLRHGRIKVQRNSPLALEYATLVKDSNWDETSGKPAPEDPRLPNHAADAALYAWRDATNFLSEAKPPAPAVGSAEWYAASEARAIEALANPKKTPWWEPPDAETDFVEYI